MSKPCYLYLLFLVLNAIRSFLSTVEDNKQKYENQVKQSEEREIEHFKLQSRQVHVNRSDVELTSVSQISEPTKIVLTSSHQLSGYDRKKDIVAPLVIGSYFYFLCIWSILL